MKGSSAIAALLDRFADLRLAVVGEAMLDRYVSGPARRLSQQAPVPVVDVEATDEAPGGAANVAVNAAALGASVRLVSIAGVDRSGERLRELLTDRAVDASAVVASAGRRTLVKTRVLGDGHMVVRFDEGDTGEPDEGTARDLVARFADAVRDADAVVVSDYGYGAVPRALLEALARSQRESPRLLVVDAKDLSRYHGCGVTAAKPNFAQTARLLGLSEPPPAGADGRVALVLEHRERILDLTSAQIAAVTLDADGAVVLERRAEPYRTHVRRESDLRASGAGDTYTAALSLALAAGATTPIAAEIASAAAAAVVGTERTATCSSLALREYFSSEGKIAASLRELAARVELHRARGRRVVLTNGCFDILHRGHVAYLDRARRLGDVLVVAVNTDAGVRRLKGAGRPVNGLADRMEVLGALSSVDHVVAFDDETPVEVVRAIRPDVFAKGGDYTEEMLPEGPVVRELGGTVRILPYLEDRSTTGVIERIRASGDERGEPRRRPIVTAGRTRSA